MQNPSSVSAVEFTTNVAGGTSSFMIVTTAVFGVPRVAPPVGALNVRLTVSSASNTVSPVTETLKVFEVKSPSAQFKSPDVAV